VTSSFHQWREARASALEDRRVAERRLSLLKFFVSSFFLFFFLTKTKEWVSISVSLWYKKKAAQPLSIFSIIDVEGLFVGRK